LRLLSDERYPRSERKKQEEDEMEAERVQMEKNRRDTARVTRTEQDVARKAKKDAEIASVVAAWAKCGGGCMCLRVYFGRELLTCPVKGLKKCGVCGDIKKSVSAKRACVAARW
jgi:hypothetical protein